MARQVRGGDVEAGLVWGEPRARWVLAATVLGTGMAFIDATVINVALPSIGGDLGAGTTGLTWVVNAYTLTLAALVLLGGSLGDRLGRRRVFEIGVVWFALASALCGLAPNTETLVVARAAQGVGGALLTPGSLAILQTSFAPEHRSRAIGAWSGLAGVAGAIGPLLGGWLVQTASWRWVFWINVPLAAAVLLVSRRHVPESRDPAACPQLDVPGAVLAALGLGSLTYGLTSWADSSLVDPDVWLSLVLAVGLLVAFVGREHRALVPMMPLSVFSSRNFSVTNLVTLAVYAAIGALFFSLVITLQVGAGFSPLEAGMALLPVTVLMLAFSARAGQLGELLGPRVPMSVGPLVAALGAALLTRLDAESTYLVDVLPAVVVFAVGLTVTVAPLTATVLASVPQGQAGLASGVNNAVARTAGLLAVAAVPAVSGLGGRGLTDPVSVIAGFPAVAWACAGLLALGGVLSASLIRPPVRERPGMPEVHPPRHHCAVAGTPLGTEQGARARGTT
jgi:EmrB/QacA subfamily drug resistance transporter